MKLKARKFGKSAGFTIIELLTVMSIIVILFGLLMPAMNLVRGYGKTVKQQAQFHAIEAGLQMYHDDFGGYPPSDTMDRNATTGDPVSGNNTYPGACKLAEALLGRDLLGFNPNSIFKADGENPIISDTDDTGGRILYPPVTVSGGAITNQKVLTNLQMRKGPYVDVTKVTAATVRNLYPASTLDPNAIVICDEYPRVRVSSSGKRVGLPVLYYKANISSLFNPTIVNGVAQAIPSLPENTTFIYNYLDNDRIVSYTPPWTTDATVTNPMAGDTGASKFYTEIQNPKISSPPKPYNADTYVLLSAGIDGLYGTRDDVFNFTKD